MAEAFYRVNWPSFLLLDFGLYMKAGSNSALILGGAETFSCRNERGFDARRKTLRGEYRLSGLLHVRH